MYYLFCSVAHSTSTIEKPKTKMQEAAQREIEEAMKKVKEAQSLITAAADSGKCSLTLKLLNFLNGIIHFPFFWNSPLYILGISR